MGGIGAGAAHDEHSATFLVKSMYKAGNFILVVFERVEILAQMVRPHVGATLHWQTRWFVEGKQTIVFVNYPALR